MTVAAAIASTEFGNALDACAELVAIAAELREQAELRAATRERRHAPQMLLMQLYGKDMIARGQRTKKISREYSIEAGLNAVYLCACHRAYLRTCPDLTESAQIEIVVGGFEPYLRVHQNATSEE